MTIDKLQTLCMVLTCLGLVLAAVGTFGSSYVTKQIEHDRNLKAERTAAEQTQKDLARTEQQRRSSILNRLKNRYVLEHDDLSAAFLSGLEPMPKQWVEEQLAAMGETWRQEQYY